MRFGAFRAFVTHAENRLRKRLRDGACTAVGFCGFLCFVMPAEDGLDELIGFLRSERREVQLNWAFDSCWLLYQRTDRTHLVSVCKNRFAKWQQIW